MLECFVISSFMFFVHFGMHDCFNFEAESETLKGINLNLVCSVDRASDFTVPISLFKDGISKSTCDNANNCVPPDSDSSRYQYYSNGTSVTVEITSLNHLADSGFWKCKLGQLQEKDYELVVKTIPSYKEFTQTIPEANSSELVENVKLSGRCYCIFPLPSEVKIYFRVGTGAFQFHLEISDRFINKRNDTSSCEPYEFDVEVSNFTVVMMGRSNVFFEMRFGDYKTSGVVGPFSFSFKGRNYSDTELLLGGFSCSLIVLIKSIIMLIILGCKMLPKIFGDLSTKKKTTKIIIIIVFIVVALIIGLALGFGLKEYNQRNLGLGLGLGLGFLLAIALVVTLFIYHKQCDSKKGTSRRAMEYISCTQSGQ